MPKKSAAAVAPAGGDTGGGGGGDEALESQLPKSTSLDFACALDPQLDFVDLGRRLMPNQNEEWRTLLNTKLKAAAWESTKR